MTALFYSSFNYMLPQVPLLYVFMSEKRKTIDYVKILKSFLSLLDHQTAVEEVVTDFEQATWRAFEQVFQNVKLISCAFHWTQALFRN